MTQLEFENLYGAEVTVKDYNTIIEPMYMATDLSKEEFVASLDKRRFALRTKDQIIKEMKCQARSLKDSCTHFIDWDMQKALYDNLAELNARFGYSTREYRIEDRMFHSCFYPAILVQSSMIIDLQGDK